uniref:BAG family molecular chaperone regulator 7 n=1 Tax=Rhizophora mucronata TaxID=61149 RepID=A0A2P2JVS7_RHIMU
MSSSFQLAPAMSRCRRMEIFEPDCTSRFLKEASIFAPKTIAFPLFMAEEGTDDFSLALEFLNPSPSPFELVDLIQIERTPSFCSYRRVRQRFGMDLWLQSLCDRVGALESRFDQLVNPKIRGGDGKYAWTAEIKGPVERKYKWTAEIKGEGKQGPILRNYAFEASNGDGESSGSKDKKIKKDSTKKKKKDGESATRLVDIEEPVDHKAVVLRQAFAKRGGATRNSRGKQTELSPQDAAVMIQVIFRAYLIRRSKALCALRELAIAKSKLKEIRALFNNFSYRRLLTRDAEERQRFSEKIIVLLLTVDAIEVTLLPPLSLFYRFSFAFAR